MARDTLQILPWRNTSSFVRSLMTAALLCLGICLFTAPAASAHDQLISSSPEADEHLSSPPSAIKLIFSAELLTLGHEIRIVDADSKNWAQGTATLTRESLSQPVAAGMPDGAYQVRWRVVSSDGHPINGAYSILVGETAQPGSIPNVTTQASPAVSASSPEAKTTVGSTLPEWCVPALFGAGAGLVLYLTYVLISSVRRRSRSGQD